MPSPRSQSPSTALPGPWMIEVVGHYIHPLVGSLDAALILEAAKALLQVLLFVAGQVS